MWAPADVFNGTVSIFTTLATNVLSLCYEHPWVSSTLLILAVAALVGLGSLVKRAS